MRLGIVGFGYVGSAVANGFGKLGHTICVYDISCVAFKNAKTKGYTVYNKLEKLVDNSEIIFVCVPTTQNRDGSNNSSIVYKMIREIAAVCKRRTIIVVKSTIMVGTTDKLIRMVQARTTNVEVLFNPEFLTASNSYKDFLHPDRIVIGGYDTKAIKKLCNLYKGFTKHVIVVDPNTAELAKYASNSFLATKVSFANQMGVICRRMHVDPICVMKIVGLDRRIGSSHLDPSRGPFGGSCLPKDLNALIFETTKLRVYNSLLKVVKEVNEKSEPLHPKRASKL